LKDKKVISLVDI